MSCTCDIRKLLTDGHESWCRWREFEKPVEPRPTPKINTDDNFEWVVAPNLMNLLGQVVTCPTPAAFDSYFGQVLSISHPTLIFPRYFKASSNEYTCCFKAFDTNIWHIATTDSWEALGIDGASGTPYKTAVRP